jgi:hypothetical protein
MTFVKAVCVQNDHAATQNMFVKFKVFMAVKIHIVAFWVMTPHSLVLEGVGVGAGFVFLKNILPSCR